MTQKCTGLQAAGKSQQETNDMLATYVRQQVEEKGAQETHMCVCLLLNCQQTPIFAAYACDKICRLGVASKVRAFSFLEFSSGCQHPERALYRQVSIHAEALPW